MKRKDWIEVLKKLDRPSLIMMLVLGKVSERMVERVEEFPGHMKVIMKDGSTMNIMKEKD